MFNCIMVLGLPVTGSLLSPIMISTTLPSVFLLVQDANSTKDIYFYRSLSWQALSRRYSSNKEGPLAGTRRVVKKMQARHPGVKLSHQINRSTSQMKKKTTIWSNHIKNECWNTEVGQGCLHTFAHTEGSEGALRPLLLLGNVGTEKEHCGTGWGALSSERWGPWECVLQWKWYWVPCPACRIILAQGVKLDLPFGVTPMPATQLPLFQEHQSCLSALGKLGKKPCRVQNNPSKSSSPSPWPSFTEACSEPS